MRTIIFFDLPVVTTNDKRNYIKFRKYLLNESVYSKILLNSIQSNLLLKRIKMNAPSKGLIQALTVTESQYAKMDFIIGEQQNKIIENEDRLIVLW